MHPVFITKPKSPYRQLIHIYQSISILEMLLYLPSWLMLHCLSGCIYSISFCNYVTQLQFVHVYIICEMFVCSLQISCLDNICLISCLCLDNHSVSSMVTWLTWCAEQVEKDAIEQLNAEPFLKISVLYAIAACRISFHLVNATQQTKMSWLHCCVFIVSLCAVCLCAATEPREKGGWTARRPRGSLLKTCTSNRKCGSCSCWRRWDQT